MPRGSKRTAITVPSNRYTRCPDAAYLGNEICVSSNGDHVEIVDVQATEWISWTPMLVLILLFGVAPGLIFEVTDPAVVESLKGCLETGCEAARAAAQVAGG